METIEKSELVKAQLEEKLIVGAKIRIGKKYAEYYGYFSPGQIIQLVEGFFEHDNGLYVEEQTAPSIMFEKANEFDSIYHLFGNNLEDFMDCEIIN